jgi:Sec-independent protein translocase protein TatA
MEWILVIIVVFAIYNAEKLPDIIKRLKAEVPHLADAGKKAAQEIKEKAKQAQEKVNNKDKTSKK